MGYLHLVPRLRMSGVISLLPPICLDGVDRENWTFLLVQGCTNVGHQVAVGTKFLLRCRLMFVDLQYGTRFRSPLWCLEFGGGF
jgi:hypothetical protein